MKPAEYIKRGFFLLCAVLVLCFGSLCVSAAGESSAADSSSSSSSQTQSPKEKKKKEKTPDLGRAIIIGLVAAVVVDGVAVFLIFNGYKNNGKTEPYPYSQKAPLNLTKREDVLVDTTVEKRKIEKKE